MRAFFLQLILGLGVALALPPLAAANPITDENAKAGTTGWEATHADAGLIDGYSDKTSIAPGEGMTFRVSTNPAVQYRINIYRLGWYNAAGARLVTCLPSCSTNSTGSARTTPSPNASTGEIDATNNGASSWPVSQTLPAATTASWTTGEYVAEYVLKSGSQSGTARYSPFVVRSGAPQASASDLLVVVPTNTYNAYNNWGNTSAYVNNTNGTFKLAHATKVSFNRPTYRREWRYWDLPLLRFLEREGYDVSYVSDADIDADPQILQQHRAVIVSGHSEYWTKNMRDGFDAARDAGTNLLFAGANDAYWQVRYEDSSCADDNTVCGTVGDRRTMVIYKQEAANQTDPISNSSLKTIKWRDLGRPECELQGGVQYGSWFPNDGYRDYTTTAAGAGDPWAQGAGLSSGTIIKGLTGFEYDSFFPDCDPPGTPTILFQYQGPETSADIDAAAVRYTANGSGARVFSSGSEQWAWGLDSYRWDPSLFTGIPPTNAPIQQFTRNMLGDMARPAPPAGVSATVSGSTVQIDTTPRGDSRVTGYKIYRHAGTGSFKPGDAGVTLVCQNASGDCTDSPAGGTYRYASVAVDQWNDSDAALSSAVTISTPVTAVNDSAIVTEDAAATAINVLANDTPSGTTKTITARTQGSNGTVVITGGGTGLTYQPDANYCGSDSFTYTINGSSTATVSMTVNCVDDPPVAVNDSATVSEDAAATSMPVLANDTDVEGDARTISSATDPAHGTVALTGGVAGASTGLTYQPDANYCGSDSFTYTINGGDTATVSVTVTCVDDPPVAVDDSATLTEDAVATAVNVLTNDTDIDGGTKTITSAGPASHGAVVITGGGTGLTYKPSANYCDGDSFDYTLNGGSTATVSVTVNCVDDPPVAVDDSATLTEDAVATAVNVLTNDTDSDGGTKTITSADPASHGSVAITGGGTGLTYKPNANYCGSDSFSYTLNGGDSATVSVTVNCVDDPPVAVNDSATVSEDAAATSIPVLANDTDVEGDARTISSATDPAHGTVALTGGVAGARTGLTYQPDANYCGSDSFTYTINGGDTATVSMTVTCVDDLPAAVDDSKAIAEDAATTAIDVLGNDTDIDGGPKNIASFTQAGHGTVAGTGGTSGAWTGLTYKPNANYCGADSFSYTLNGGDSATVSVTVSCVDDPPVAVNDSATVTENADGTAVNVLANDTDVDGGTKTIASAGPASHGSVAITGAGAGLTYKPNANYCGADSFSYTLNGGDSATVSVTVNCVDDPPVAVNDSATVTEDADATAVSVLANDTDVDGGTKTIASATQPAHGQVVITGGGTGLTYRPTASYCGTDSFTYTVNGGSTATVSVTVSCVDDAPVAVDDSATLTEDAVATAVNVLTNDTDIDGGTKTIASAGPASHGAVVITGGGTGLTYKPNANYCGADSFDYTLNGGSTATVSVTVNCVDDPPTAVNDSKTITEDAPATAIDVLVNDTDVDGGPKTINSVNTTGAHGTVAITGGGTGLTYKPNANYCNNAPGSNPDTFTYALNGGDSGTVLVTVNCVDDPPVAVNDSATVAGNSGATVLNVLSNDTDVDGGAKTIGAVTQPGHGTVQVTGGGTGLTYRPAPGYCGADSFTYTLNGGDTATVSVTVDCGQAPTAVNDSATIAQDSGPNLIDVLANDTDPDGGPKLIDLVTQPDGGTVAIRQSGAVVTYEPHAGYCNNLPGMGLDSFDYRLNGGSTAAVSVIVNCAAGGVAGDSATNPKPVAKKCKKKLTKKARAKCRKKQKKRRA